MKKASKLAAMFIVISVVSFIMIFHVTDIYVAMNDMNVSYHTLNSVVTDTETIDLSIVVDMLFVIAISSMVGFAVMMAKANK